jgi:hypothetical protein
MSSRRARITTEVSSECPPDLQETCTRGGGPRRWLVSREAICKLTNHCTVKVADPRPPLRPSPARVFVSKGGTLPDRTARPCVASHAAVGACLGLTKGLCMTTNRISNACYGRMQKTGESYTAARANPPKQSHPTQAGTRGDRLRRSCRRATPRSRPDRVYLGAGSGPRPGDAQLWPHREIVRYVQEKYKVPDGLAVTWVTDQGLRERPAAGRPFRGQQEQGVRSRKVLALSGIP